MNDNLTKTSGVKLTKIWFDCDTEMLCWDTFFLAFSAMYDVWIWWWSDPIYWICGFTRRSCCGVYHGNGRVWHVNCVIRPRGSNQFKSCQLYLTRRRENLSTHRKTSHSKEENQQQSQPTMWCLLLPKAIRHWAPNGWWQSIKSVAINIDW